MRSRTRSGLLRSWRGAAFPSLLFLVAVFVLVSPGPSQGDAEDRVEEALQSIFQEPGYDAIEGESESTFQKIQNSQRFLGRVGLWFTNLITQLTLLRGESPTMFWFIFIGLNIVLVLLLWHIAYVMRSALRRTAVTGESAQHHAERVRRSGEFVAAAEAEAARGSFGEALRNLLLAVFARFAEENQRNVPISKTNREVLTRLPVEDVNREELGWLVGSVDDAWYGRRPATVEDFDRGRTLVRRIAERAR